MTSEERISGLERAQAIDALSCRLFMKSEHLDPTGSADWDAADYGWSKLSEFQQDFYRSCVKAIVSDMETVRLAGG